GQYICCNYKGKYKRTHFRRRKNFIPKTGCWQQLLVYYGWEHKSNIGWKFIANKRKAGRASIGRLQQTGNFQHKQKKLYYHYRNPGRESICFRQKWRAFKRFPRLRYFGSITGQ